METNSEEGATAQSTAKESTGVAPKARTRWAVCWTPTVYILYWVQNPQNSGIKNTFVHILLNVIWYNYKGCFIYNAERWGLGFLSPSNIFCHEFSSDGKLFLTTILILQKMGSHSGGDGDTVGLLILFLELSIKGLWTWWIDLFIWFCPLFNLCFP